MIDARARSSCWIAIWVAIVETLAASSASRIRRDVLQRAHSLYSKLGDRMSCGKHDSI